MAASVEVASAAGAKLCWLTKWTLAVALGGVVMAAGDKEGTNSGCKELDVAKLARGDDVAGLGMWCKLECGDVTVCCGDVGVGCKLECVDLGWGCRLVCGELLAGGVPPVTCTSKVKY